MSISAKGPERRQQKRYHCCGPVKVIDPRSRLELPATIQDISLTGCALRLRQAEWLDDGSDVELNFKTSYFSFRVVGSVRCFMAEDLLVRIQFLQLNERGWSDIIGFIRDQGDDWTRSLQKSGMTITAAA